MSEIITLQFGTYANYVGAHLWNLEDELNGYAVPANGVREIVRSSLFRGTLPTDTPRLVLFDFTGASGSLHTLGTLHPDAGPSSLSSITPSHGAWNGASQLHESERVPKNPFLQSLDDEDFAARSTAEELELEMLEERHGVHNDSDNDDDYKRKRITHTTTQKSNSSGIGLFGTKSDSKSSPSIPSKKNETRADADRRRAEAKTKAEAAVASAAATFELDGHVKYWSDYLKTHIHHKSVYLLPGVHYGTTKFEYFTEGLTYVKENSSRFEDMCDRIRYFAEECDTVAGFHVHVDVDSGFAGVAHQVLQWLREEYPNHAIITFGYVADDIAATNHVSDTSSSSSSDDSKRGVNLKRRCVNESWCMTKLASLSSLYIPITPSLIHANVTSSQASLPLAKYRAHEPFHSSAVIAAAVHTATLPYRVARTAIDMHTFCSIMAPRPRLNLLSLNVTFPAIPSLPVFSPPSSDSIGLHSAAYSTSLSPWGKVRHRDWIIAEWPVLRGERALDDFKTYSSSLGATTNSSSSSSSSSSTGDRRNQEPVALATRWDNVQAHISRCRALSRQISHIDTPIAVPLSFPHFFAHDASDACIITNLYSSPSFADALRIRLKEFGSAATAKGGIFQFEKEASIESDEWEDVTSMLHSLAIDYEQSLRNNDD